MTNHTTQEQGVVPLLAAVLRELPKLTGAACAGRSELFDPAHRHETAETVEARHARAVGLCRTCPALIDCRTWADSLTRPRRPAGVLAGHAPHQTWTNARTRNPKGRTP